MLLIIVCGSYILTFFFFSISKLQISLFFYDILNNRELQQPTICFFWALTKFLFWKHNLTLKIIRILNITYSHMSEKYDFLKCSSDKSILKELKAGGKANQILRDHLYECSYFQVQWLQKKTRKRFTYYQCCCLQLERILS